jgi:hypothetical protein
MSETIIGYARCSSDEQDLTAQRQRLAELGVAAERIYLDHGLTGTTRARPGFDQALAAVRPGDTLVVPKFDRLARSVPDARAIGDALTERGIKLSLGGQVNDPADPMGKMFFNIPSHEASALRGFPLLPDQRDRLADCLVVRAVDPTLDGDRAVVADLLEGAEAGAEIEVAASGLQAVAVGDVDIDQVLPIGADAGRDVDLLDFHVEEVRHDADLGADFRRDGSALLHAIDDVGLVAVQRLEKEGNAGDLRGGS